MLKGILIEREDGAVGKIRGAYSDHEDATFRDRGIRALDPRSRTLTAAVGKFNEPISPGRPFGCLCMWYDQSLWIEGDDS